MGPSLGNLIAQGTRHGSDLHRAVLVQLGQQFWSVSARETPAPQSTIRWVSLLVVSWLHEYFRVGSYDFPCICAGTPL